MKPLGKGGEKSLVIKEFLEQEMSTGWWLNL